VIPAKRADPSKKRTVSSKSMGVCGFNHHYSPYGN
jgi:hypothetical protein